MLRHLIELVAPTTCVGCGAEGDVMCTTCVAGLAVPPPVCYRCGQRSPDGITCGSCRPATPVVGATVALDYEGATRSLLLQLKFQRAQAAARIAARLLTQRLDETVQADVVTAVPIGPQRYRERGYNQAELVAKRVARSLGLPYRRLLARSGAQHQIGRGRSERLAAITGSFFPIRRLKGQRVLLIDDVLTTGATVTEAAHVLQAAGSGPVWVAAVARRRGKVS